MGEFAAGQVDVLPFPFSDLTRNKYRPALLLADVDHGDWIACQITSNAYTDVRSVAIERSDFEGGGLQRQSFARPGKLFTANATLFAGVAGKLRAPAFDTIREAVVMLIRG